MASFSVSLSSATATGTFVTEGHFGTNALHDINISATGNFQPNPGFAATVDALDVTRLRYPGGHVENTIDITRLENGQLRAEVRAFMDWCVANSTPGNPIQVTIVLPTKVDVPAAQIEAFVYLLLEEYGDHVTGFEIGNEYSIGPRDPNFDRSTHPEDIPGSDFVSSMTETEYGIAANRVINATQTAIERLAADHPGLGHDPLILIQLGDPSGAGSAYKGNGNWDQANEAILAWLNPRALAAIDGAVAHYYYNISHEDSLAFDGGYQQVRSIDHRIANFNAHLGREVPLFITEWNVLNGNDNQLGMASPSVLLEMFEFMVRAETAEAFIWPLQHRTGNTIGGNRSSTEMELSPGGAVFQMMKDSLEPERSAETGHTESFQSMSTQWSGTGSGAVEINYFASPYHDVLYVSLRDLAPGNVRVNLQPFLAEATSVEVTRLTMDRTSSDGLSDLADENGLNRIGRRTIDAAERDALARLAFFDPNDKNHLQVTSGQYRTYLPTADGIIPLKANPTSINDYYFATEIDVDPLLIPLTGDFLGTGQVTTSLMPYDVVEIVIEKKWVQEGTTGHDRIIGGIGQDVVLSREGDDTISTGEGNDSIKSGFGNDLVSAGSGNDTVVAGSGNDTVNAGAGDDLVLAGTGTKVIHGGTGKDTVRLDGNRASYAATLDNGVLRLRSADTDARLDEVETLVFGDQTISVTDFLSQMGTQPGGQYASSTGERLNGTSGNEVLGGGAGADVLIGTRGRDTLIAGAGDDLLIAESSGLYGTDASAQVYRAFKAVFGREPDTGGHQYWTLQLASGAMSLDEIMTSFVASPEFQARYGATSDARFVTLLFNNVFGRDPLAAGLNGLTGALATGTSRAEVVRQLAESPEHQGLTAGAQARFDTAHDATEWSDEVYRLYRAFFDREPDGGGFAAWTTKLATGTDFGRVVTAFMTSPEFQSTYGATSNAEFVTLLYRNVLKRAPDAAGLAGWIDALDDGMSRVAVVSAFIASPEFVTRTAGDVVAFMRGMGADDLLEAGTGNDILSGGLYADTFVFEARDDGRHVVTDLEAWDTIALRDFGYATAAQALAHMTQQGDDIVFQDQGVTVVFSDFQLSQITADMLSLG